ncbi:hypothetical protein [Achromobacter animicus]|uniref:hypothetical protein n=1 Tax=Achromobacter animicus TaxID=1389935 RepID=UPI0028AC3893|nr:hypothetical protein [Achromobacter animicus]
MKTQTINLIALRSFLHGYNVLSVGDALVTTPGHAKQLIQLGHARPGAVPEPMVSVAAALGGATSTEPATPARALLTDSVTTGADGTEPGPGDPPDATLSADSSLAVGAEPNSKTGAAVDAGSGSSSHAEDAAGDAPQSAQGELSAGHGDPLSGTTASSGGTEPQERATEDGADADAKGATRQRRRAS